MPENWSWRTRQLLTCRCVSVMLPLDAKYTKELADAKAENDALRDDVATGRRRLHIKAVLSVECIEATTASGVDNAASPRLAERNWTGLFHPQEADHYAKTTGRARSINRAVRIELYIDGQLNTNIVSNTHALPAARYKCLRKCRDRAIPQILRMFAGFLFNNIFCAATNFGCIDSFSSAQFRNEEMMRWWFPLVLLLPVCFEQ